MCDCVQGVFIRGIQLNLLTAPLLPAVSRPSLVPGPAHSDALAAPVVVETSPSSLHLEKKQNAPVHGAAGKVAGVGGCEREDGKVGGGGGIVVVCLCIQWCKVFVPGLVPWSE